MKSYNFVQKAMLQRLNLSNKIERLNSYKIRNAEDARMVMRKRQDRTNLIIVQPYFSNVQIFGKECTYFYYFAFTVESALIDSKKILFTNEG